MSITPVEPVYFQSVGGPPYCSFFAIAPEGSRIEHLFTSAFWKRVVETLACKGRLLGGQRFSQRRQSDIGQVAD